MEDDAQSKVAPGQTWTYKTRAQEPLSTLTILKMESHLKAGDIVHVRITGLNLKNSQHPSGIQDTLPHMPISAEALSKCVIECVANGAVPDYQKGYDIWREQKGGVFTISVAECIQHIESIVSGQVAGSQSKEKPRGS